MMRGKLLLKGHGERHVLRAGFAAGRGGSEGAEVVAVRIKVDHHALVLASAEAFAGMAGLAGGRVDQGQRRGALQAMDRSGGTNLCLSKRLEWFV